MSLDATFLITFLSAFTRCTAMVMSSPLFGTQILPSLRNDSLINVNLDW